jgi:hypothetical protein
MKDLEGRKRREVINKDIRFIAQSLDGRASVKTYCCLRHGMLVCTTRRPLVYFIFLPRT